jgi:chaperonin GroEL
MSKVFCREQQLNTKLLQGIQLLADNVASTMGPRGRTVIIHERDRRPFATKDGVSVARSVTITDDPVANVAVQIMKQAAEETANTAGDGTTTSTVLARSILVESQKYLAAGISPIELKRGIDKVVVGLTNKVKELAKPVTKLEDVENVATISANGDLAIGKLIAEAVDLTGKDGAVTIKEGKSLQTTL